MLANRANRTALFGTICYAAALTATDSALFTRCGHWSCDLMTTVGLLAGEFNTRNAVRHVSQTKRISGTGHFGWRLHPALGGYFMRGLPDRHDVGALFRMHELIAPPGH